MKQLKTSDKEIIKFLHNSYKLRHFLLNDISFITTRLSDSILPYGSYFKMTIMLSLKNVTIKDLIVSFNHRKSFINLSCSLVIMVKLKISLLRHIEYVLIIKLLY